MAGPRTKRQRIGGGLGLSGGSNVEEYREAADRVLAAERPEPGERIVAVPVDRIDRSPYQAREEFDPAELDTLAADIDEHGVTNPITLRPRHGGRYELVAGERRWLAAQRAGHATVPARVREVDDFEAHLIGVSENSQRMDLSPYEQALEVLELQKHARGLGRPASQRDLGRYFRRDVARINHQLQIAAQLPREVLADAGVTVSDVCILPRETLLRIAKLPEAARPRALREAIRMQGLRRVREDAAEAGADDIQTEPAADAPPQPVPDRWTRFWEEGGFQVQVRKPLRDLPPGRARKYIDEIVPAFVGLAARAAADAPVQAWEHERGRVLFIRPDVELSDADRHAAIAELEAAAAALRKGDE